MAEEAKELIAEEKQDYAAQRAKAELEDFKQEIENRRIYTGKLYRLMLGWMIAVLVIVVVTGIHEPATPAIAQAGSRSWWTQTLAWITAFKLSDNVLLALIGGLSASVIGLFLVVANYLFPRRGK
jgi:hypothetical protein